MKHDCGIVSGKVTGYRFKIGAGIFTGSVTHSASSQANMWDSLCVNF